MNILLYIVHSYNPHIISHMMKIVDTQVEGGKIVGSIQEEDDFIKWFEENILVVYNLDMNNIKSILDELTEDIIKNHTEGTYFLIKNEQTYSFVILEKEVRSGWIRSSNVKKHRVLGTWKLINDIFAEKEYHQVLDFKTATKNTLKEMDLTKITMIVNCNDVEILSFFPNLRNLHFEDNALSCRWFKKGEIPNTVEVLQFPDCYKLKIDKGVIPNSVKTLIFGSKNTSPNPGIIPDGVERIYFGPWFNGIIKPNTFPDSVIYLEFGKFFNQVLNDSLPPNLRELVIKSDYVHTLSKKYIPDSLEHIRINGISYKKGNCDFEKLMDKKMFDMSYHEIVSIIA